MTDSNVVRSRNHTTVAVDVDYDTSGHPFDSDTVVVVGVDRHYFGRGVMTVGMLLVERTVRGGIVNNSDK